ncbi:MAG: alpha/beta hydrolase [Deltaproteobacteria bacterium]|nr:alpha/beta hydrolase [Deltaproteobacteria bacterium]
MRAPYDHPAIGGAYFFPTPGVLPAAQPGVTELRLGLADGNHVRAYWSKTRPGAPTLLCLYGNRGLVADGLAGWRQRADQAGLNLLMVDYPGFGGSGGTPSFSSCREAANVALRYLLGRSRAEVPGVILFGRSAGSTFALDAAFQAASRRVLGLVLDSGVADLQQRIDVRGLDYAGLGIDVAALRTAVRRDFDHRAKLRALQCPVLVLHTRADAVVPMDHAERLAEWSGDRLHRLVLFPRGGHNDIFEANAPEYRTAFTDFVAHCRGAAR